MTEKSSFEPVELAPTCTLCGSADPAGTDIEVAATMTDKNRYRWAHVDCMIDHLEAFADLVSSQGFDPDSQSRHIRRADNLDDWSM